MATNHLPWLFYVAGQTSYQLLADMMFGQLQTKKQRSTLLTVDDLLIEFESMKRRSGRITGLAVTPLSSVEFASVFESLGYGTKHPKDFGFVNSNTNFSAACTQAAKRNLSPALKVMLGPGLSDNEGMVRISSSLPTTKAQEQLSYEERLWMFQLRVSSTGINLR